ncbi:MAG: GNAT family N-acetyltransferase [Mycobacteriales bacterium]
MTADRFPVRLLPMTVADLALVESWLSQPHVARWYLAASTITCELDELRSSILGQEPTEAMTVLAGDRPIGWCQSYRCDDYPDHAAGVGAQPGDIGIDYAIGDPAWVGRGVGTALVSVLVNHVRPPQPEAGIIADPEAANIASRRVLEKNGFELLAERPVPSEATNAPMAIYRLAAT